MDPDATLKRLLEVVIELRESGLSETHDSEVFEAADLIEALDDWLSKGGFLPTRWQLQRGDK